MPKPKTILLVANGDLRLSANQVCWPAQEAMEKKLAAAVAALGGQLVRAHPFKPAEKHGFMGVVHHVKDHVRRNHIVKQATIHMRCHTKRRGVQQNIKVLFFSLSKSDRFGFDYFGQCLCALQITPCNSNFCSGI